MKFLALATLSVFGLVAAQDLTGLPTCAYQCALSGIGSTGCAVTDSACICAAQSFLSDVQNCITAPGGCDEADVQGKNAPPSTLPTLFFSVLTCSINTATLQFAQNFCGGSVNGTNSTSSTMTPSSSATGSGASMSATESPSSTESSSGSSTSASESSSETGSSGGSASASVASVTSGAFAKPTLAALGVAQLLGVAGVAVAAL